jgi:hypothetical protein
MKGDEKEPYDAPCGPICADLLFTLNRLGCIRGIASAGGGDASSASEDFEPV